jgi:hypothetical protein
MSAQYAIVAFPELDRAEQIASVRRRFDPMAGVLEAHITVVLPFADRVPENEIAAHLHQAIARFPSFEQGLAILIDFLYRSLHRRHTMRRRFAKSSIAVASVALVTTAACAARAARESPSPASPALADSIGIRLADLEIRRIAARASEIQTSAGGEVDAQINALHDQLRALPNHVAAERTVALHVLGALDARDVALTARLREMRMVYTDNYPVVRDLAREEQLVSGRRNELRITR